MYAGVEERPAERRGENVAAPAAISNMGMSGIAKISGAADGAGIANAPGMSPSP